MTFTQYVAKQMERFGAMALPFGMKYEEAREPLMDCMIDLSGQPRRAEKSNAREWSETLAGSKIAAVCTELSEGDEVPTLRDLKAAWTRMFPATPPRCGRCEALGGYVIVERDGVSGAQRCNHQ